MTEPEPAVSRGTSKRSRKRAVLIAGAALLVTGLSVSLWRLTGAAGSAVSADLTYDVRRGDLRVSFTERGSIKALKSVSIYSHLEGPHTIVTLVPEGSNVKTGDVLVELDSSDITQQLNQQQIQVETAEADLLNAQEQLEIQRNLGESDVEDAKLKGSLAELDLEKYLSPRGEYEIASTKAKAGKTIAEEELSRAQNKLNWTEKLAAKGYVTGTELIADRLEVSRAKLQVEEAQGELELLEKYTFKKQKATYESAVTQARQALDRSQRKARAGLAQAEAAKKGKQATLNLSRKRLAKLQDQLDKTKVRAPQDGMVVYPNVEPWRRERMIMQGAEVHENQLLMNLPDVSTMAVDVQVHESWVDQVKEGLPAFVSIDALPNLNLRGTVTKVGLLPDSVNRWMNPDLKVYQTEITLDASPEVELLRPGMSAKVEILIALLDGVISVPVQSVSTIDKQQVCYVRQGRDFVPRPVQGGRHNESFIEIVSGLEEGEVIQLTAPPPSGDRGKDEQAVDPSITARIEAAEKASREAAGRDGGRRGAGERPRGGSREDGKDEARAAGGDGGPVVRDAESPQPARGEREERRSTESAPSPVAVEERGRDSSGGERSPAPTRSPSAGGGAAPSPAVTPRAASGAR